MEKWHRVLHVLIVVLGIALAAIVLWRVFMKPKGQMILKPLTQSDLGTVSAFTLTERSGRTVGLDDLRGKTWVADFIFTRCAGPCPVLTSNMAKLQDELAKRPDLMFVSFTVDPGYDTPQVLAQYADRFGADKNRWYFLTGKTDNVSAIVMKSFRLAMQENTEPGRPDSEAVNHALYLVLVDKDARIRGYYNGTDPDEIKRLRQALSTDLL